MKLKKPDTGLGKVGPNFGHDYPGEPYKPFSAGGPAAAAIDRIKELALAPVPEYDEIKPPARGVQPAQKTDIKYGLGGV